MNIEKQNEMIKEGFKERFKYEIEQLKENIQVFITNFPEERDNIKEILSEGKIFDIDEFYLEIDFFKYLENLYLDELFKLKGLYISADYYYTVLSREEQDEIYINRDIMNKYIADEFSRIENQFDKARKDKNFIIDCRTLDEQIEHIKKYGRLEDHLN